MMFSHSRTLKTLLQTLNFTLSKNKGLKLRKIKTFLISRKKMSAFVVATLFQFPTTQRYFTKVKRTTFFFWERKLFGNFRSKTRK